MRYITNIVFSLVIFPFCALAQSQPASQWIVSKKVSWNNYGYCVSSGPEGNVYVSGAFTGPYRNPGPQDMGCFFTCYNSAGVEQWHKEFYSIHDAITAYNKVDSKGNVILAGPGILKFNSKGLLIDSVPCYGFWRCDGFVLDQEDNLILAGRCMPDSMIGNFKIQGITFLTKFDALGKQLWAKSTYINYWPNDFHLSADYLGNIYTTGGFGGTIQVSDNIKISAQGYYDGFIIKYSPDSQPLWAKRFGGDGISWEFPQTLSVSNRGDVYITGTYNGVLVAETFSSTLQQGVSDLFVIKYDNGGNVQWLKSGGGADQDKVWEMTIDDHDNIFISGAYDSPGTFVWEGSPIAAKENDKGRLFVLQLDTDGNPVTWLNAQGGHFKDLTCDNKGNLFATGARGSKVELPGKTLESEGGMFLAKLSYDRNNKVGLEESTPQSDLFQIFPNPGKDVFT